ncbi:MAG: SAM-dependent methyltransferase, partial [Myxococcota bacterium]
MFSSIGSSLDTRSIEPERMDPDGVAIETMAEALKRVGSFTRLFGGVRAVRRRLREVPGASVLDVGAGDLALVAALARGRSNGGPLVGVDSHADVVSVAGRTASSGADVHVVRADGRSLPFADRSFDVVISTLTLHHLDDSGAAELLSEMGRVARRFVFVWDLERSTLALGGALALAHTVWRGDSLVRHDAPLSVRRAFTAAELSSRAQAAGLRDVRV